MPIIGFMPIMGFIIPLPIIGFIIGVIGIIPMFELCIGCGIAFIMMGASYVAPRISQAIDQPRGMIPLFVRRSVSPAGGFSVGTD
jgi:hypothetical protein